jgi:hypothetical protein
MLLQSHDRTEDGGFISDPLPALPKAWPTGKVSPQHLLAQHCRAADNRFRIAISAADWILMRSLSARGFQAKSRKFTLDAYTFGFCCELSQFILTRSVSEVTT